MKYVLSVPSTFLDVGIYNVQLCPFDYQDINPFFLNMNKIFWVNSLYNFVLSILYENIEVV